MLLLRFTRKYGDRKSDWQLDVVLRNIAWNHICLFSFDHALNPLQRLRRVQKDLGQREVVGEPVNVFWHHKVHSLVSTFNVTDLQDLGIVAKHIRCHLERWNVNYIHIGVLGGKYSTNLSIFTLQELVHWNSFAFLNRQGVYMDLDSLSCLNCWPLLSELFHHLFPHKERFVCKLINSLFSLLLELEQTEAPLDSCRFGH